MVTLPNFSPLMMTRSPRISCWPLLDGVFCMHVLKELKLSQPVLAILTLGCLLLGPPVFYN